MTNQFIIQSIKRCFDQNDCFSLQLIVFLCYYSLSYSIIYMLFYFIQADMSIFMYISGFDGASGILFLKFTDRYKQSAAITAWLGSLATALRLSLGMKLTITTYNTCILSLIPFTFVFLYKRSGYYPTTRDSVNVELG